MQPTATQLFERYHVPVYRYFVRSLKARDVAEDLTQEVFLRILRYLGTYRDEREAAWVFRIARSVLVDYARRHRTNHVPLEEAGSRYSDATQVVAFGLSEALALLPDQDRNAFLLREIGGLSYAELASVCDMPTDTVRSRVARIRCRLRALLERRLAVDESRRRTEEG